MTFGVDGVSIFKGIKSSATQYVLNGWAPHSMGVSFTAHITNLVIQILSHL
jgi:hypothetical protein